MQHRPISRGTRPPARQSSPLIDPAYSIRLDGRPPRIACYKIGSNDSVLCCSGATTMLSGVVAPSQRRVLVSEGEGSVTRGHTKIHGKATPFPYA